MSLIEKDQTLTKRINFLRQQQIQSDLVSRGEDITGTSYEPVSDDNTKILVSTNAGATTVTIEDTVPVGFNLKIMQGSTGVVTLAPGAGVTLRSQGSLLSTNGLFAVIELTKIGTGIFVVTGNRV